jgi:Fe-S-cluster containining protein
MHIELGPPIAEFTTPNEHDPDGIGFRLEPGGHRFRIALAKHQTSDLRGWCTFFHPDERAGGCTVYGSRPMPCRVFPATLQFGRVALRDPTVCPDGVWTSGTALWQESWRRTAERSVTEQLVDFAVNTAWNRTLQLPPGPRGDPTDDADAYRRYIDWVTAIYLALDHNTGCLDRATPLAPSTVVAAKSLLLR